MGIIANKLLSKVNLAKYPHPAVMGSDTIMSKKAHGTSDVPVQENLLWKCDRDVADRI